MPDTSLPRADLLQFHVLTAFPPHNVNRDEDGRPKSCQLGGTLRGRISSQAKKRALRFAPHFPDTQRALRTREAGIRCYRQLTAAGIDDVHAVWAALAVNHATGAGGNAPTLAEAEKLLGGGGKGGKKGKAAAPAEDAIIDRAAVEKALGTEQGLVISTREFARIDEAMARLIQAWQEDRDGFAGHLETWVRLVAKEKLLTTDDHDLDTALFGRMVAADPGFNIEAACAVGHAFTTHAFREEPDYFSAGEELNELKGTGAAITSYAFFGGGVYYQHAVLDRGHLRENLTSGRTPAEAKLLADQAIDAFLTGLVLSQPKGKRNSHASDVGASYVLVTRGGDPSLNLGLAFLDPVTTDQDSDIMKASIGRLADFQQKLAAAYGLGNDICIFNAYPPARANQPAVNEVWTMAELRNFVLGSRT